MARKNKVNHLFKGLKPSRDYTVAEIVQFAEERGILDVVYPDETIKIARRKAKQLVQSHVNANKIESCGTRQDVKIYRGQDFVNFEEREKQQKRSLEQRAMERAVRRLRVWLPAAGLLVMLCLSFITIYSSKEDPLNKVGQLAQKGDVAGLLAFNQGTRTTHTMMGRVEADKLADSVIRDLGVELPLEVYPVTMDIYPFQDLVAGAVSQLEPQIHHLSMDRLVAVLPYLEEPFWLFADEQNQLFPVQIGVNIAFEGTSGFVTRVQTHNLVVRLHSGETTVLSRPPLELLGRTERVGPHSTIYTLPSGNLKPLLRFISEYLDKPFHDASVGEGQVVGFFPPVTHLSDLFIDLHEVGAVLRKDGIYLDAEPAFKLQTSLYQTPLNWVTDLETLFREFGKLTTTDITLLEGTFNTDRYMYTGQSFYEVCRQSNVLPMIENSSIILVR